MGDEFDERLKLTASTDVPAGLSASLEGEYDAGWSVGGGINGGFQLALLGQAMRATVPDKPDPITVSAGYLTASDAGPVTATTRILRNGGSLATVAGDLTQDGTPRLTALATMGTLAGLPVSELDRCEIPVPDLPPRDRCLSNELAPPEFRAVAPFMDRFEMLFDPRCVGWAMGQPSGRGMLQAWFRLPGGRQPDPLSLLLAVDALPPVSFDLGRPGWAPTLELTVHLRALPAPGWLRVRHETRVVAGGMFEEDCVVFDAADRLVAQSRQLARLPRG